MQMETITENHNRTQSRDQQVMAIPSGCTYITYLMFMALEHERRGTGIILRARIPGSLLKGAAQTRTEQWQYQ